MDNNDITPKEDKIAVSGCLCGEGASGAEDEIAETDRIRIAGNVLIQAGHLNTPDDKTGAESIHDGQVIRERDWTPIVRDTAVKILRDAGLDVISEDASFKYTSKRFEVKLAVFVHCDSGNPAVIGTSVGYDDDSDRPAAQMWKGIYKDIWPYVWQSDNYTSDLKGYYGYKYTTTEIAEMVIELGNIDSKDQVKWLQPRLTWLGALLAHFISKCAELGSVPMPPNFVE